MLVIQISSERSVVGHPTRFECSFRLGKPPAVLTAENPEESRCSRIFLDFVPSLEFNSVEL